MNSCKVKYCILVGVTADTDDLVTYNGVFGWNCFKRNRYVKSVDKDFNITYTGDEKEALCFYDDVLATKTMRAMLKDKNFRNTHILVWYYERGALSEKERRMNEWWGELRDKWTSKIMHYPNEHWHKFNNLQPVLMNHTVGEYERNPY